MSVASPLSVEPPWVVHELSSQWFLPASLVAERLADLHRVVDGWVTAGSFVLAPPLRLEPFGYAVSFDATTGGRWVGPQVRLDDRSTVDLVGRVTRPLGLARRDDLLVVDLAATAVDRPALERLMRHVYTLRRRFTSACVRAGAEYPVDRVFLTFGGVATTPKRQERRRSSARRGDRGLGVAGR